MKRINFFMICALISVYTLAQNEWADIWCNQWNILEYNVSGMGIPEGRRRLQERGGPPVARRGGRHRHQSAILHVP